MHIKTTYIDYDITYIHQNGIHKFGFLCIYALNIHKTHNLGIYAFENTTTLNYIIKRP